MRLLTPVLSLLGLLTASVAARPHHRAAPSVFLLAGDSTTATQAANGGGWGDGFKNRTLLAPSFAENHGVNGRTTASYVSDGYWASVLSLTKSHSAAGSAVFVTIQFGHNDQKLADFAATFQANLKRMVGEVTAAGGTPVLVTPLSRRNFNADGTIDDALSAWAGYTLAVAAETGARSVDLWKASVAYLEKIGETAARRLDLKSGDATHLNADGSVVFGRLVSDLVVAAVPGVKAVTRADAVLSKQIADGVPSY
ncbi:putative esterase [Geopyxis carbonaria]|nr:putative esterase [Geopyxis carbonaria]